MIPNCSTCDSRGGIFKIIDGMICFVCLDYLRHKAGYDLDGVHELDKETVKKIIAVTKQTNKVLLEEQKSGK